MDVANEYIFPNRVVAEKIEQRFLRTNFWLHRERRRCSLLFLHSWTRLPTYFSIIAPINPPPRRHIRWRNPAVFNSPSALPHSLIGTSARFEPRPCIKSSPWSYAFCMPPVRNLQSKPWISSLATNTTCSRLRGVALIISNKTRTSRLSHPFCTSLESSGCVDACWCTWANYFKTHTIHSGRATVLSIGNTTEWIP